MTELERSKNREKMLERELTKLAGENWQASLDITPSPIPVRSAFSTTLHPSRTATSSPGPPNAPSNEATLSHIEQVRLLILGMEQRLQVREEKLVKSVERAEREGGKFEEMRKEVMSS